MAPYEEKGKIMKFFSYLARNNVFVFVILIIASSFLTVLAWYFLPIYFSLGVSLIIIVGLIIFTSYKKDFSIPLIRNFLRKEYFLVKFKYFSGKNYLGFRDGKKKNKKKIFARLYLKVINYLILLFENSEESFHTLKEDAFTKLDEILEKTEEEKMDDKFRRIKQTIKKIKAGEEVDKDSLSELEKELFEFSKFKQKKATVFSLTAITALIITTVTAGLISSFLFPEVFKTKAASYGFLQTSWAGGASSDNASHSNQTGWTKYFSKDNVSTTTPTELKLSLTTTTIFSQTSDSDWQTHATSSTYYSGGSVGIAKPNGITCSTGVECNSGFCVDSVCCNTACTGSTCQRCDSYSNAGIGTCGYVSSSSEDPDNNCVASGCSNSGNCSGSAYSCSAVAVDTDPNSACSDVTCTNYIYGWSGNNCVKYSGSSSHNGMCNGAGTCYTTVADSCSGAGSTSASCGSAGCLMACVAGSLATSYDSVAEICYTSGQHSCASDFPSCNATGTCQPKRVFTTSVAYNGCMGGLAGADAKCQARADAAGLGGTWVAWLSTSAVDGKDRIQDHAYYLVDNITKICSSKADLIDGTAILNAINLTETGGTPPLNYVWTDTSANGIKTPTGTFFSHCSTWTTCCAPTSCGAVYLGYWWTNVSGGTGQAWTSNESSTQWCDSSNSLYCFEN